MIKRKESEIITLRKENLRLKEENLRLKEKVNLKKENQTKFIEITYSVCLTALLAVFAFTFNFYFSLLETGEPISFISKIRIYLMLVGILLLAVSSTILWRKQK